MYLWSNAEFYDLYHRYVHDAYLTCPVNGSICFLLGLGFVTSITFIFVVGVFMSSWLGASVLSLGEWFIKRMPFVRHIYSASKQISAAISPGLSWCFFLFAIYISVDLDRAHWFSCLVPHSRSKHSGIQRGGYHKTSSNRWICIWIHHFMPCFAGMELVLASCSYQCVICGIVLPNFLYLLLLTSSVVSCSFSS